MKGGRTVVLTRPSGPYERPSRLVERLGEIGLSVVNFSSLSIERVQLAPALVEEIRNFVSSSQELWFVVLSPTAATVWAEVLRDVGVDPSRLSAVKIAAHGKGTEESVRECFGRKAHFIPSVATAEIFAAELSKVLPLGAAVVVPQSSSGRNVVAPYLTRRGYRVLDLFTYETRVAAPTSLAAQDFLRLDFEYSVVVFMSPSAVRATKIAAASIHAELSKIRICSIGPHTSQAIVDEGLSVWREAEVHSEEGIIACLSREWSSPASS